MGIVPKTNDLSNTISQQYQQAHKLDEITKAFKTIQHAASIAGVSMKDACAAFESFYKLGGNANV